MGYDKPVKLRIWGGNGKCKRTQILAETDRIEHTEWQTYSFTFTAKEKLKYIIIEAFHSDKDFSHQGNILVDEISEIRKCGKT